MNKSVVFDFDGVIINSSEVQKYALLKSYKIVVGKGEPSFDEFFSHSGDSLENIFKKMNLPQDMLELYRQISRKNIDSIKVYDGVRDLLLELRKEGYSCGLCTGKDRERTIEILEALGLLNYFNAVVCSTDVANPKPHPESLLLAIKILKSKPEKCVMIGDAINDILCAKEAGITSIAVTWGETQRSILENELPDYIADDILQLYRQVVNSLKYK